MKGSAFMKWYKKQPFFIRLVNWEYWPFFIVYFPFFFYWLWLSAKARSFFFFNAANPTIENGGYLMESKYNISKLIPSAYHPKTFLVAAGTPYKRVENIMQENGFAFPVVAKPDIGMKGKGVRKIDNRQQLEQYTQSTKVDFLIQEYIAYPNEVGIFYCRFPDKEKGFISGIVSKELLSVRGDGHLTIRQLILQDERSLLQLKAIEKEYKNDLAFVLEKGEEKLLVPYGNHARGAKFIDATKCADEQLTDTLDAVCKKIKGFYFGRLDIRYSSWGELKQGRFMIIELNGAGSEPTHIYDPKHSIVFAWKEIARHLQLLYQISKMNHTRLNAPYLSFSKGLQLMYDHFRYQRKLDHENADVS